MGRLVTIALVDQQREVDEFGDWVIHEIKTHVYAEEMSVSQKEFYQGMANGFKPEVKFVITNWLDYSGQEVVEYVPFGGDEEHPIRLRILRLYNDGDKLELTCYRSIVKNADTESTGEDSL